MANDEHNVDVSRRDLATLLGVFGGAAGLAALNACSQNAATPEAVGREESAYSPATIAWFQSIVTDSTTPTYGLQQNAGAFNYQIAVVVNYYLYPLSDGGADPGITDGGGGLFYWDATSTATPDGGTVFALQSSDGGTTSGRWLRIYSGPLDIRWFGATTSAADNTAAIQRALTAATQATGSSVTVYVPAGTYAINQGNLAISGATGLVIRGDGFGKSIIVDTRPDSRNASVVTVSGITVFGLLSFINCSNCGVTDLQLVGNCKTLNSLQSANINYNGIFFYGSPNCFVHDSLLTAFVDVAILAQGEMPNWDISHNIIRYTNLVGVNPQLNGHDDSMVIAHNFFDHCYFSPIEANGGAVVIHGNTMTMGLDHVLGVNVITLINATRAVVTDNVIYDSDSSTTGTPAIAVLGATWTGSEIIISNNTITGMVADWTDGVGSAINIDTSTAQGASGTGGTVVISNNLIDNCGRNDMTQARAITVDGPYVGSVFIFGNTIRNRLPNNIRIGEVAPIRRTG